AACATLCGSVSVFFSPEFLSNQAIFWFSPWLGRVSYNIRESHCQNAVAETNKARLLADAPHAPLDPTKSRKPEKATLGHPENRQIAACS
ncbi:MAG: hypothetical protein ACXWYD_02355, partial [Candidatus Binatia bacterium]